MVAGCWLARRSSAAEGTSEGGLLVTGSRRAGHSGLLRLARAIVVMSMAVCLMPAARPLAHEIVVEQIVEVTVAPRGSQLVVQMHVPAAVLVDARLPHRPDGTLDADATSLAIVAADLARNLDVRQADAALAMPIASARIGADRRSIDLDLTYALRGGGDDLSARLNTFAAAPLTSVRTHVRFVPTSGSPQIIDVTGAPARVTFDPPALAVARELVTRALTSVLGAGDHLLLLMCLLLASRRAGTAVRLIAMMLAAQTISIVLSGPTLSGSGTWPSIAATIAASAIVVGALQTIVGADARWIAPVAVTFGLLNGVTFGQTLATSRSLAGGHPWMAVVTFVLAIAGGQLWIGGVMWATWRWLIGAGISERIGAIVAAAFVAHTALHRVVDRAQILADSGVPSANRALVWLTVAWAGVMVIVAAIEALRRQQARDADVSGAARSS
jgi:hypothetical protein